MRGRTEKIDPTNQKEGIFRRVSVSIFKTIDFKEASKKLIIV
jgi:hypothetical protein